MKKVDSTDSNIVLPNEVSLLALGILWIEGILNKSEFANSILTRFRIETRISRFCRCCSQTERGVEGS
jgi:hypothetical protein